jgi:hypothetical protein
MNADRTQAEAEIAPGRAAVRLRKGGWAGTIPAENLDAWIEFYRRLRDRKGGRYAEFYDDTVRVLEAAKHQLARDGKG